MRCLLTIEQKAVSAVKETYVGVAFILDCSNCFLLQIKYLFVSVAIAATALAVIAVAVSVSFHIGEMRPLLRAAASYLIE